MAVGAEFPCGVLGGEGYQRCVGWLQGLSFLVVCREGRGIGAVVDALWGECGIGAVVDTVE